MRLPAFGFDDAPFAYGAPQSRADFKTAPEDFIVEEVLGFEPCGEGEHLFLLVQTDDQNTQYTLKQLARHFKLAPKLVSYSGLKDRRGLTSQWFSLHLPGKNVEVDTAALSALGISLLRQSRHNKKLRIGTHKANRFHIRLRNFSDDGSFHTRIHQIIQHGVPNYFGPQRFGHHGHNVNEALHWVEKNELPAERELRGRVLSTLRAWLFNGELAQRIAVGHWLQWQPGDPVLLDGSHSFFHTEAWDNSLQQRFNEGDIHIGTWLWSTAHPGSASHPVSDYLAQAALSDETRPLRLLPRDLTLEEQGNDRILHFNLPTGSYATSLLREIAVLQDRSQPAPVSR